MTVIGCVVGAFVVLGIMAWAWAEGGRNRAGAEVIGIVPSDQYEPPTVVAFYKPSRLPPPHTGYRGQNRPARDTPVPPGPPPKGPGGGSKRVP